MKWFQFGILALLLAGRAGAATPEEIRKLVADLGAKEHATREAAQKELTALGEPAAPYLQDAINANDPELRLRAEEVLRLVGTGDIEHPDPVIVEEVADLLSPINGSSHGNLRVIVTMGKRAVPALVELANRNERGRGIYAMIALTQIADARSFPALAKLFQEPNIATHMSGYVGKVKDPRLVLELIKLWMKVGDEASNELRAQVRKMSQQELGDEPAAYQRWFAERYGDTPATGK